MATTREQLAAEVTQAVSEFQDATDEFDHVGAGLLGVNRTDLRCLGLLSRRGAMTAGQLATEVGLTTGSTTTAIDRLVRKGYVERVRDDHDRRRITIEITPEAAALIEKLWGPLGRESQVLLMRRSKAELEAILEFLREGTRFQAEHADRIRRQAQHSSRTS
ncbi:MarR family winged helix-turn-helix transcriptional regulator [Saccharopolyspora mangrovi]|uniref:MarR family transcriptional regulator n=1 Tax=Saccharopolyspora mangrovi TaxID=3082379 RepID=A0ABU6AEW2_9PSEU|nr:MarR family transcriptional regulator [Saccharopolyspora sp. S2-29]MEB3370089.1 MarR family transcriptional regulator [Saccharopolyspora sp. S2-29]